MFKYEIGNIIEVKVTAIEPYGSFVTVDEEYTGLIHISEITGGFIKNINDYYEVGDKLLARILDIDDVNKHIKLTLKGTNNKYNFRKDKLKETELGFSLLEELLPKWIEKKVKEIEKNK